MLKTAGKTAKEIFYEEDIVIGSDSGVANIRDGSGKLRKQKLS
jgi:hypothetical protein